MEKQCRKCPAGCCRYFSFPIDRPETYEDFEQIRWYLLHRGISVYIDADGQWNIIIRNLCRMLRKTAGGWRCKEYASRPPICRGFSPRTCDFTHGGIACEEFFGTGRQLESYAGRMLGEAAFDKARSKMTAKMKKKKRR